jgi:hypothetical protein
MNKNTLSLIVLMTFQLIFSQEKTKTIEEVVVKKEIKTFTNTNGNLKVDVANSIYNAVSNPIDVLSKLLNIQVSPDKESITIIGIGTPLLYIDNQKKEYSNEVFFLQWILPFQKRFSSTLIVQYVMKTFSRK